MSRLRIFAEDHPDRVLLDTHEFFAIASELHKVGVRFERWSAAAPIHAGDAPEKVMAAYSEDIQRMMDENGYRAVDVVSLGAEHPQKIELRKKFLDEHTHSEDEVRFFVDGHGLFSLHIGAQVFEILCERGDLIGVPDNTRHWFDMGPNPNFVAIRLFSNPAGWVANYTGTEIAAQFPRLEN